MNKFFTALLYLVLINIGPVVMATPIFPTIHGLIAGEPAGILTILLVIPAGIWMAAMINRYATIHLLSPQKP